MNLLSGPDCREWCIKRGLLVSGSGHPSYPSGVVHGVEVKLPRVALQVIGLAIVLSRDLCSPPRSTLLWLTGWDIWSEDYEAIGANLLRKMLARSDPKHDIAALPGQLFAPAESLDLRTFLTVPMLFQWDAFLVPEDASYIVFLCHDGLVSVTTKTASELNRVTEVLAAWGPKRVAPN